MSVYRYTEIKDNNNDRNGNDDAGGEVNNTPSAVCCWCSVKAVGTSRCIAILIIIIIIILY